MNEAALEQTDVLRRIAKTITKLQNRVRELEDKFAVMAAWKSYGLEPPAEARYSYWPEFGESGGAEL